MKRQSAFYFRRRFWQIPRPFGKSPSARWGHTMTFFPDFTFLKTLNLPYSNIPTDCLFVFGGWDGNDMLNDSHFLMIDKNTYQQRWEQFKISGKTPSPRAGHTTTLIDDKYLVILGGGNGNFYLSDVHILDLKELKWIQPKVTSNIKVFIKGDLLLNKGGLKNKLIKIKKNQSPRSPSPRTSLSIKISPRNSTSTTSTTTTTKRLSTNENLQKNIIKNNLNNNNRSDDEEDDESLYIGGKIADVINVGFGSPSKKSKN